MTVPAGALSYNVTASATIAADDSPCVQNPASASGTLGTPRFGGLLITLDERFKLGVAANHGRATPCAVHGCGMLPNLRFAIGAVLASALLIVAAFGLAATVRVAHHRAAAPDDPWRTLAFTDPNDFGLLTDRPQPTTVAKSEAPKVPPAGEPLAAPSPPPATVTPRAPAKPAADPPDSSAVEVVAAIPSRAAEPVQSPPTSPGVETPSVDDEPLEPSERVGVLPGLHTAGLPLEHPIALPVPDPRGRIAAKATKKKTARRRYRFFPWPPVAGYPARGFPEIKYPATSNDRKWTTLGE